MARASDPPYIYLLYPVFCTRQGEYHDQTLLLVQVTYGVWLMEPRLGEVWGWYVWPDICFIMKR